MTCEGIEHLNYPLQHKLPTNQHTTNIPTIHSKKNTCQNLLTYYHHETNKILRKLRAKGKKIRPQLIQTKIIFQIHASLRILLGCNYLWVWKIPQHVKIVGQTSNHKVQMCCQLVAKFGFDKNSNSEASFILNKTDNLDHSNFYQLKIFCQLVKKAQISKAKSQDS